VKNPSAVELLNQLTIIARQAPIGLKKERGVYPEDLTRVPVFLQLGAEKLDGLDGLTARRPGYPDQERNLFLDNEANRVEKFLPDRHGQLLPFTSAWPGNEDTLNVRNDPAQVPFQTLIVEITVRL
jgi:hypothetical protein